MKLFISWSGTRSRRLAEVVRDWLPLVIQRVTPYFTPNDVEKGSRWLHDIAGELEDTQVGVLILTRDSLESSWLMFEAGALSKSLEKARVCPVLFGISNTDLSGPLRQFQTTEFKKSDVRKLVELVNSQLGDEQLPDKVLTEAFGMWWPRLEEDVTKILSEEGDPDEPIRTDRELLEELVELTRRLSRSQVQGRVPSSATTDLLRKFISLHDEQAAEEGGYRETLNAMQSMAPAIDYIASRHTRKSPEMQVAFERFHRLSYSLERDADDDSPDDEFPS